MRVFMADARTQKRGTSRSVRPHGRTDRSRARGGMQSSVSSQARGSAQARGGVPRPQSRTRVVGRSAQGLSARARSGQAMGPGKLGAQAAPVPERRSRAERAGSDASVRHAIIAAIVIAATLMVGLLGFLVLSYTPLFTIKEIDAQATEHVSAENIAKFAQVKEGTTLLNLDEDQIRQNLQKNPWVGDVSFEREFPDRLKIVVSERQVDCVVIMNTGNVAWCLDKDNVWIEPLSLSPAENGSITDAAFQKARELGALLISEVPASVSPVAGSYASDDTLRAVKSYRDQFSERLSSQIVSYSAASLDSISCTLESGVEISLGAASSIDAKEAVINQILAQYSGKITYINVRVPSKPSYRMVGSDYVQQGSGTT